MFVKGLASLLVVTLPATVPWLTFFLYRAADHSEFISSDRWDLVYDYIVVGAGSAGCVVANRLSEDPSVKVLLLEAGGSESVVTDLPTAVFLLQQSPIDWGYKTTPQNQSCLGRRNRQLPWPRGKVLGGTSTLNAMLYVRGNPADFDSWARAGATGWSYDEVLPYFKKAEDNRDLDVVDNGYHGRGGPMQVQRFKWVSEFGWAFLESAATLGFTVKNDFNNRQQLAFAQPQAAQRRGARCSSAKAYLSSIRDRANLRVVTFSYVTRILFNEQKEAVGVMFDRLGNKNQRVFARREVIVSGGTINSAQLLMLSGIGPRHHLESLGIPVVANLPVGDNLKDHHNVMGIEFVARATKPVNEWWTNRGRDITTPGNLLRYVARGNGPLSSPQGADAVGFVRTSRADPQRPEMPDLELIFTSTCLSADDGFRIPSIMSFTQEVWDQVFAPQIAKQCYQVIPIALKPKSTGQIRLQSADPYVYPSMDPAYFSAPEDLDQMVEGIRIAIALGSGYPFSSERFDASIVSNVIPGCEHALPLYSGDYLRCMARVLTGSMWHQTGTCRMGAPGDPNSVVDPDLRVKGVGRLRVVDASIIPEITCGNTHAPVVMVAEKGSDLIKSSWSKLG